MWLCDGCVCGCVCGGCVMVVWWLCDGCVWLCDGCVMVVCVVV